MFITTTTEVGSGATLMYIQVPCVCSLLSAKVVHEIALAGPNTLAVSDGNTDVIVAQGINAEAGQVFPLELEASAIVKAVEFDADTPIEVSIAIHNQAGTLSLAFELDEFVRKTD